MATPTDEGLAWYNRYSVGDAPGPIDTIAVGTGTDAETPTATSLQSEVYRASVSDAVVSIVEDSSNDRMQYAVIELTGGLEIPAGTDISEIGVITTATDPETLVWYDVSSPQPFDSGEPNKLTIPMGFARGDS